ncbi:MAG: TraC family protein [Deltaproteobacteria bacterium]|nr:TraC family protein [Deltaproteobacteria bacterium]
MISPHKKNISVISDMPSLAELLPFREFLDNVVVFADKQASMGCAYELEGVDVTCNDVQSINQLTRNLRNFLNSLPDGIHIQFMYELSPQYHDLIQKYERLETSKKPPSNYATKLRCDTFFSEMKDERLLKPIIRMFLRYTPQNTEFSKMKLFETASSYSQKTFEEHQKTKLELEQIADNMSSSLSSCGIETKRLNDYELIEVIYCFLNPTRSTEINPPTINRMYTVQNLSFKELQSNPKLSHPSPREQLVFSDLLHNEDFLHLDEYYYRVITLKTTPEFTNATMIRHLLETLPFPFYFSLNIEVPNQSKEFGSLQRKRKMTHALNINPGLQASDLEAEAKLHDTEDLIQELIQTGSKIFYMGATLIIKSRDPEELQRRATIALSKIRELNSAEGLIEEEAQLPVFLSCLPMTASSLVRSRRMKTANLADFLPVYEPNRGNKEPMCLFKNREEGILKLDTHDSVIPNYSSLVTGISGSGKSFLVNYILLNHLRQNENSLAIVDVGNSYKKLVEVFEGDYLEIKLSQEFAINPLELPHGETKPSNRKIKTLMAFLDIIFCDEGYTSISKLERNLLEKALLDTYSRIKNRNPRLSDLKETLEKSREQSLQNFAKMLYSWTGDRPYGILLDRDSTISFSKNLVAFDLNGLSQYKDLQSALILILTDAILDRVENTGGKKLVVIDEGWSLIRGSASGFIEYVARAGRKRNTGLVFITQGIAEILESPIASAILNNTANKFILRQASDLDQVQKNLKLNDQEIELISSLQQKRGEYSESFLMNHDKRAILRVAPTPFEYWLATTHPADLETLEHYQNENPQLTLFECIKLLSEKFPKGAQFKA